MRACVHVCILEWCRCGWLVERTIESCIERRIKCFVKGSAMWGGAESQLDGEQIAFGWRWNVLKRLSVLRDRQYYDPHPYKQVRGSTRNTTAW